ncbi:SCO4848 family membrane protein [Amycolatopsis sp. NPDC051903]|uniref:SCO4848 family membrane protein n=1 Tax=Amycolatopsis sp. NPDC051903 TaxID=3363936 RepID=UPI0037ADC3D9
MRITRGTAIFFLAFGVWSWIIWITFAKNLWASDQSWAADGSVTGYFIVHAVLTVVSFVLGTIIGVIGWRALRASRATRSKEQSSADA